MRKSIYYLFSTLSVLMLVSCVVAAQSRASVSAAEVNGTFKMNFSGKFKEFSNDIKILALGGGRVRFAFDLVYPYSMQNGEQMVNMGSLDDEASIVGDTAKFVAEDSDCRITIKFVRAGIVRVTQGGTGAGCGFGHNVMATGTYKKVSGKKPKFDSK